MAIKSADQISIVDVTDAYSVILTSEAYTFAGTISAAKAGSTTTQIIAMRGAEQIAASVVVNEITKPSGVTVTSNNNATAPTLTIQVSTSVTSGGVVKIPVHIGDITITKEFSFAIAFTGATGQTGDKGDTGKGVKSTAITYQAGASGTSNPTGTWSTTIPTVSAGQYLWTRTIITYTDDTTSTSYSVGMMGATGAKGDKGDTGEAGADAITLSVTSSNGTIFKNSAISTILTAHVYKAGTELNATQIAALGTIKWYKDGGSTAVATGNTLTISAGDVSNKATYIAQLEG